ncbi:uncharacterized protein PHALS_07398 [Plasmopara halstedii]|uniref:Uncharacterized protein n=1 Tax=Plasmopara halstedii TaxID=4781 RepID=A0A0P1B4D3_PLAHL|nr:uncharacterized protein PHALS_07398 [Plasmopara halstedii]CEG49645.1 hypothetical protein PHALS_07398 [Plasmopara halstedii]|eukprot:XP_024586014.1 hypothetical protein PHALS_07398 [Plasmopara halstedii]
MYNRSANYYRVLAYRFRGRYILLSSSSIVTLVVRLSKMMLPATPLLVSVMRSCS